MTDIYELPVHPAAELFPMLGEAELAELAADIERHGLREPVWLWRDPDDGTEYVLDGRNRLAACRIAGVEVRTQRYDGDDPISFVVSINIQRRHLTTGQKAFLALELVPLYENQGRREKARAAAEARRREAVERGEREREQYEPELIDAIEVLDDSSDEETQDSADPHYLDDAQGVADRPHLDGKQDNTKRSTHRAAAAAKSSGRVVGQAKRIHENAPDLAEKVKDGSMAIDRADRIIRDREAEQRRIEQAKREAEAVGTELIVDIRHGDFREVLADLEDVDAIITDPPYPHEFIPLLADLATFADKVLAPDGVLAVLIGQTYLPEVYRLLDGGRPYRWTGCYLTAGAGYVSHPRKVQSNWKPLIVYGGGPRFSDVIRSEGSDAAAKSNHKWGQDYLAFHTIVERLTSRGQTVVDPFMGSGTTLLAAHAQGRDVIGCDIEAEHVARARERLS